MRTAVGKGRPRRGRRPGAPKRGSGKSLNPGLAHRLDLSAFPPGLAGNLVEVQRNAGNRATTGLLEPGSVSISRDNGDTATATATQALTQAQIARAERYYARRRELFTESVVRRVQEHLGATPTGRIDTHTIELVAQWQAEHPPQPVDGMAGERTLSMMFPEGLATEESLGAYETARNELAADWEDLDADGRMARILRIINVRLAGAGVPAVSSEAPVTYGPAGYFRPRSWSLAVHAAYLRPQPGPEDMRMLMRTLYHEAGHAEQHFLMARYLAGRGRSAAEIARTLDIPANIASAAESSPLRAGSARAVVAAGFLEAVTSGREARVYREKARAERAADRAWARYESNPTEANLTRANRASARSDRAVAAYEVLASEFHSRAMERRLREMHGEPALE